MKRISLFIFTVLFLGGALIAIYRFPQAHIESVTLVNGKIEVVKSQINPIQTSYLVFNGPDEPLQKRVWKEIYSVQGGQIVLEKIIEAKIIPAEDERWEFPKE